VMFKKKTDTKKRISSQKKSMGGVSINLME